MSQFFLSSAEKRNLAQTAHRTSARDTEKPRITGFTEAELAAAKWSRDLVEVREKVARPTNLDAGQPFRVISRGAPEQSVTKDAHQPIKEPKSSTKQPKEKHLDDGKVKKKKDKKNKEDKKLEKGAKKLAKKMRKDEKHRTQKECTSDPEHVEGGLVTEPLHQGIPVEAAIDQLIEHARVEVSSANMANIDRDVKDTFFYDMQGVSTGSADAIAAAGTNCHMDTAEKNSPPPLRSLAQYLAEQEGMSVPVDPRNPLESAYDLKAYKLFCEHMQRRKLNAPEEPEWDHLPFLRRSPSPCRLRTDGAMWPTRRGAWKSRAGGAYLPPTDAPPKDRKDEKDVEERRRQMDSRWSHLSSQGGPQSKGLNSPSRSQSIARYLYPEEFAKRVVRTRRSPDYKPEPRCKSGSSNSSRSRSRSLSNSQARSRRANRKQQQGRRPASASSHSDRASPVYEIEGSSGSQLARTSAGDTLGQLQAKPKKEWTQFGDLQADDV